MADIISISNRTAVHRSSEPDQAIIDQLKKMLAQAESGQLQAIFAVGWLTDNSIMSGWQGADRAAFIAVGGALVLRRFHRPSQGGCCAAICRSVQGGTGVVRCQVTISRMASVNTSSCSASRTTG